MKKTIFSLALAGGLGTSLSQAATYPKALPPRLYGLSQYASPSCQAEAESQAVEQVFANMGKKILVSPLHRHWKIWQGQDGFKPRLPPYTPEENATLDSSASFVPDYMWPAGDFREGWSKGARPRLSSAAVIDSAFPKDQDFGFSRKYWSFSTQPDGNPWSNNGRDLNKLISTVVGGAAVVLELHGVIFDEYLNDETGLVIPGKYSQAALVNSVTYANESSGVDSATKEYLKAARRGKEGLWQNEESGTDPFGLELNHAVVVVGYDAGLYAGEFANPGAFIIRNSWNDASRVRRNLSKAAGPELERFKYPLFRAMSPGSNALNLPGYYALPAQYVQDMLNYTHFNSQRRGVGGYYTVSMDWDRFAQAYSDFMGRYKVWKVPFVCNDGKAYAQNIISNFNSYQATGDEDLVKMSLEFAFDEALVQRTPNFRIASLTEKDNKNILQAFGNGAFDFYYCANDSNEGSTFTEVWPRNNVLMSEPVLSSVEKLSMMPESPFSWVGYFKAMRDFTSN